MNTFPNTRKALADYTAQEPALDAMFESVTTADDLKAWSLEVDQANERVCMAFYEDTKGYNGLNNCMLLTAREIRVVVGAFDPKQET